MSKDDKNINITEPPKDATDSKKVQRWQVWTQGSKDPQETKRKFKNQTPGQVRDYKHFVAARRFKAFEQIESVQIKNEDAPVNSVAGGGVDMAPNAKSTSVFIKRRKVDGRSKEYREAVRRIKERQEKINQREVEKKLSQFGLISNPFMEQKTMSNKYLETKEGSLEDAVFKALNPNKDLETLKMPEKKEELEEKITPDNYNPDTHTQTGAKQKIKPSFNTKTHRLIVKDGKVKVISRAEWEMKRKDMRKQGWDLAEDNTNDRSDDGEGMDKVQPKALKKKFKDRKDKDIDNDGDTDSSDEYLHNRRKAISKAMESSLSFKKFRTVEEAHEVGTDEYAKYTREMTPGEGITNSDAKKADVLKKKEQNQQQNQLNVDEKKLTPAELKKREEVAKAIERDNPDMPMDKKMAIATSTAKKAVEAMDPEMRRKMKEREKVTHQRDMEALKRRHAARMSRLSGKSVASGLTKNEQVEEDYGQSGAPQSSPLAAIATHAAKKAKDKFRDILKKRADKTREMEKKLNK